MTENNPFGALEDAIGKQRAEETSIKQLTLARTRLIRCVDHQNKSMSAPTCVFFATLVLRWQLEVDWSLETMATDGRRLVYNPGWVASLSLDHLIGTICHEAMHNALAHHARQGDRDLSQWNEASDLSANPLIIEAGFHLPHGHFMPGEGQHAHLPKGKSAEEYYPLLRKPSQKKDDPDGDEDGHGEGEGEGEGEGAQQGPQSQDPGKCGGTMKPGDGSEAACREAQAESEVALAQAEQAARALGKGNLPGGLARLVQQVLAPKVDWREVLREFVSRQARNDFSWSAPNRRFLWQGLYLPGLRSEELGDVVVAVDTSGSISGDTLDRFASELQGILECYDCSLTLVYHDACIQHVQQWKSSDGPLVMEPKGGGGTSHVPVFEWVSEHGEDVPCVVCLTDLATSFPDKSPPYPVLWCVVEGGDKPSAPFGQVVEVI